MFDISKQELDISCPECEAVNKIILQQVADEEIITCNGCGKTIQLKDEEGKTKDGIASVTDAFNSLGDSIKKFGK